MKMRKLSYLVSIASVVAGATSAYSASKPKAINYQGSEKICVRVRRSSKIRYSDRVCTLGGLVKSLLLFGVVSLSSGCANAASPYYLDCQGTMEFDDLNGKKQTQALRWAFLVDESGPQVRSREGLHGPFVESCNEGCDGVKFSDQFIEWSEKVTAADLPGFESHTHTQINRKTGTLAQTTWVGADRNADLNSKATWATCRRSSEPPKAPE